MDLIALAIPVFFAMIAMEMWLARRQGQRVYRLADAVTDLSCGIGSQVIGVFLKVGLLAAYVGIYRSFHLLDLDAGSWVTWLVAMVGVDLAYYAWHRASHRINLVWATHVPHHQSQDYNLAVALRQAWFSSVTSSPFYWTLAVLGVPPVVFLTASALNTLYQFWIHTETVGKLGPLEWVLNTPSHHRVHHGVNPEYIDKNYAGILIVWDRLFGTFEEERAAPCYGTVKRFESYNPIWANFEHLRYLWREALAAGPAILWRPPEWRAPGRPALPMPEPVDRSSFTKWDAPGRPGLAPYVLAQLAVVTIAATTLLFVEGSASWPLLVTLALWILWSTATWGALFEGRSWGMPAEVARLAVTVVLAGTWASQGSALGAAALLFHLGSAGWLLRGRAVTTAPVAG